MTRERIRLARSEDELLKQQKQATSTFNPLPQSSEPERLSVDMSPRQQDVFAKQQTHGNAAVRRMLRQQSNSPVRREDDDAGQSSSDEMEASQTLPEPEDMKFEFEMPVPEPIPVNPGEGPAPANQGPGDYPLPSGSDSDNVMAMRDENAPVVRRDDDDKPHISADAQMQVPVSLSVSGIYRNFNLAENKKWKLEFGHEPTLQLSADPKSGLSAQFLWGIVNRAWMMPILNKKAELQLQALASVNVLPKLSQMYGGGVQFEQHLRPWLGFTLGVQGGYVPATKDDPGKFSGISVTGGWTFHWEKKE